MSDQTIDTFESEGRAMDMLDIERYPVNGNWGDEDLPIEVRRELLQVASRHGMSYYYLCAIYRRGFQDGRGIEQLSPCCEGVCRGHSADGADV